MVKKILNRDAVEDFSVRLGNPYGCLALLFYNLFDDRAC
jgi:hypothetical protein